ncbi:CPBP family intramembrane glutamic endopeptidase [Acidocella sp.]|uniref:CPBP family intramembrane glutamic endopeptidase n=1 Tax=Acidocella sp. TaxID=50710 RepID=UPI00262B973B|nr:CPBP family intramembrane glutamic endopeptidase [Acidocella sp.]
MKRVLVFLGWVVLLGALGFAAMAGVGAGLLAHTLAGPGRRAVALAGEMGAASGAVLALALMLFDKLPGVAVWPRPGARLGLGAGLWGMAGFLLAMAAGGGGAMLVLTDLGLLRVMARAGGVPDLGGTAVLGTATLAGELAGALWLAWVLRRLGAGARAAGWCAAPGRAYGAALLLAVPILAVVAGIAWLSPPDARKMDQLDVARLLDGPLALTLAMAGLIMLGAPVLEEITFRGIALGGIGARLGRFWGVVITSLAFTALHAGEKLSYPPGFVDVALLALGACWLRLRFGSVKPGILLHITYNMGSALVAVMLR